jgi:hypothetical protein
MPVATQSQMDFLRSIDTPTVCNLVEIVAPERRGAGYTVRHLHCPFPDLPPMVGYAKTVTFKAKDKVPLGQANYMQKRLDYLDYVASAPQPAVMIMHDLDGADAGYGAFWGEVQSNVHKALGALGVVTDGSIREIPMIAGGFQMLAAAIVPSHAMCMRSISASTSRSPAWRSRAAISFMPTATARSWCRSKRSMPCWRQPRSSTETEARIIAAAKSGGGVEAIKAALRG